MYHSTYPGLAADVCLDSVHESLYEGVVRGSQDTRDLMPLVYVIRSGEKYLSCDHCYYGNVSCVVTW